MFVKQNLALAYKVPRDVHFIDELPRNATGKIVKRKPRRARRRLTAAEPAGLRRAGSRRDVRAARPDPSKTSTAPASRNSVSEKPPQSRPIDSIPARLAASTSQVLSPTRTAESTSPAFSIAALTRFGSGLFA